MEEFDFDLQYLETTTNFNNQMSHFSAYNESGDFKCNYQSPTYNSYQINNPIFNIVCDSDFFMEYRDKESHYREDTNRWAKKTVFLNNIYQKKEEIEEYPLCPYINNYTQLNPINIESNEDIIFISHNMIIDMLKRKCREIIPNEYNIEIFI